MQPTKITASTIVPSAATIAHTMIIVFRKLMKGNGGGASLLAPLLIWYLNPHTGQVATSPIFKNRTTLRHAGQLALALFIFGGARTLYKDP